ncbi:MAG TPA: ferrous iron transport protein B [Anaerolineaceae bacterium]|nr:ferrous iron transport protein B [Anaerolineaceae bacterium]
MKFVLVGQPNSGKSTLFNQVCGYRAETGNFTGTTVTVTESKVRLAGNVVGLADLPGTYTLAGTNPAEQVSFTYLTQQSYDCIINVVDASHLALGLDLTLELLEIGHPIVLALNMMDEADRVGIRIDVEQLHQILGIPVIPMIASKGRGIQPVFMQALHTSQLDEQVKRQHYSMAVESAITRLKDQVPESDLNLGSETIAIKLLEKDQTVTEALKAFSEQDEIRAFLDQGEFYLDQERHTLAEQIANKVVTRGARKLTLRDKLDDYLLHPFWGYIFLILILYLFFQAVFLVGGWLESPLLALSAKVEAWVVARVSSNLGWLRDLIIGLIQGISSGLAIVLPYLLPFLAGLGLLEDVGYLPRIAFMMDALMHRMGLHGGAIVPFILGFGCNVPSIMATRTIDDEKEQYIAAALATMVPCAARLAVVFGLVAFYLGPVVALGIYIFNLFVIAITGRLLARMLPEDHPGLILEIPPYREPTLKAIFQKAWFRIREFIVEAWPVLIIGSIVLALMNTFNVSPYLNRFFKPITWLLDLPNQVGVPLIFGILRKELSLVMLGQAMGSMDFRGLLTPGQMITYTVFVIFYMPCLATLVTLQKELGKKAMWSIMGMTLIIALISALAARGVSSLIF